ncbi:methyltransferase domain-containing protein [Bacillus spizizenii]|uniref:methyltransferase domain-containing protein n=1 Tax=Bacillus spizizenii TaxID=96241 RepID=UPI001F60FA51|nr:methyltransferase domain-containing protein [Bacillus spizizenii]MCI4167373.1 methyltransferase domain-containing protein [Bacillus spizizenii]
MKRIVDFSQFAPMFRCPHCGSSMDANSGRSLICTERGHTFDKSRHGYVNFLTKPVKTDYDAGLFEARSRLIGECQFFEPLHHAIANLISYPKSGQEAFTILDSGCGEGSHLNALCGFDYAGRTATGAGIDLSKDGIIKASRTFKDQMWAVADVARAPFHDRQFDVVLSIFSPSNYAEFHRLLKDDGMLIKVVPRKDYLIELRQFLYTDSPRHTYSNMAAVERFTANVEHSHHVRLRYVKTLDRQAIHWLLQMTPLVWSAPEDRVRLLKEMKSADITVDVDILIGMK